MPVLYIFSSIRAGIWDLSEEKNGDQLGIEQEKKYWVKYSKQESTALKDYSGTNNSWLAGRGHYFVKKGLFLAKI